MTDDKMYEVQILEFRKRARRTPLSYILLISIPAMILGVIINIILFPIYVLWMVYAATVFAIHHIHRPEELFRNMRNAEF